MYRHFMADGKLFFFHSLFFTNKYSSFAQLLHDKTLVSVPIVDGIECNSMETNNSQHMRGKRLYIMSNKQNRVSERERKKWNFNRNAHNFWVKIDNFQHKHTWLWQIFEEYFVNFIDKPEKLTFSCLLFENKNFFSSLPRFQRV
jgi:hypothetical protein